MAFFSKLMRSTEPGEEGSEVKEVQAQETVVETDSPPPPAQAKQKGEFATTKELAHAASGKTNGEKVASAPTEEIKPKLPQISEKLKPLIEKILFSNRINDALDEVNDDIKKVWSDS